MDERFPDEFVTWHHKTAAGVKVDEVFGMDSKSGVVWIKLAQQIFCEQGFNYRVIDHYPNGAPFMEGYPGRVSITHTKNFMAVAILPKTPEIDLESFSPRAALGIDAEPLDRNQVIKVRDKFLSPLEQEMIPADNLQENVLAWTIKEAAYKAALTKGLDLTEDIKINTLPVLYTIPDPKIEVKFGEVEVNLKDTQWGWQPFKLFSYQSYGCCVTIAISPKAAKFGD